MGSAALDSRPGDADCTFRRLGAVSALSQAQVERWPEAEAVPSVIDQVVAAIHLCHDRLDPVTAYPPRKIPARETARILADGSVVGLTSQPLVGATQNMWDVGQTLRGGDDRRNADRRSRVRQFAEAWLAHANIKLDFVNNGQPAHIRVAFDAGGSWSAVGRDSLGVPFNYPTMNFGWFDDNTSDAEFSRVVIHEFGHALGLVHEHQSPVAGIPWDREEVYAHFLAPDGWDRAMVGFKVFQKYTV